MADNSGKCIARSSIGGASVGDGGGGGDENPEWFFEFDFVVPHLVVAAFPFFALFGIRRCEMGTWGRGGVWGGGRWYP